MAGLGTCGGVCPSLRRYFQPRCALTPPRLPVLPSIHSAALRPLLHSPPSAGGPPSALLSSSHPSASSSALWAPPGLSCLRSPRPSGPPLL